MKKEYDFSNARRGPVLPPRTGKTRITIRIDDDVLNWFRNKVHEAGGGNYQTLINDTLRSYIQPQRNELEESLRRIIREEFSSYTLISGLVEKISNYQKSMVCDNKQSNVLIDTWKKINSDKTELVEKVAGEAQITKADAERTISALFQSICDTLKKYGRMSLPGFGTFQLTQKRTKRDQNLKKGKPIEKPGVREIRFKANKQLEKDVRTG